jgi:hypothetical protein
MKYDPHTRMCTLWASHMDDAPHEYCIHVDTFDFHIRIGHTLNTTKSSS